jgi:hypothetical protein
VFIDFSWGKVMNPLLENGRLRVNLSLERPKRHRRLTA